MIEYEDIFNDRFIMYKTIPLEETGTIKSEERLCSTCGNYRSKLKCRLIGKIKNPNCIYCSWWKAKGNKIIKTKRCNTCGELKTIDEFYKSKANPDGHQDKCSKCAIEYGKEYQRNNKKVKEIIRV